MFREQAQFGSNIDRLAYNDRQLDVVESQRALPSVIISEQPKRGSIRFRYECEGRLAGSISGANSTADNPTFPSIKLVNGCGPGTVFVSLVTDDTPARPHPHSLVGQDCANGICVRPLQPGEQLISFPKIGVQCKPRRYTAKAIEDRLAMNADPFNTHGPDRILETEEYDYTTVCLCFQVYLHLPEINSATANSDNCQTLSPVVSDAIVDKQTTAELQIIDFAPGTASCKGGEKMIILCKKLTKHEEIEVVFSDNNTEVICVPKRVGNALILKAPAFRQMDMTFPVEIEMFIRMKQDSDVFSAPKTFVYSPHRTNEEEYYQTTAVAIKRKRVDDADSRSNCISEESHAAAAATAFANGTETNPAIRSASAGNDFELLYAQLNQPDPSGMLQLTDILTTAQVGNPTVTLTTLDNVAIPIVHIPSPDSVDVDSYNCIITDWDTSHVDNLII